MAVTTIPVGLGSAPGDGLGDKARTGGTSINTSISNLDAAVEYLQSGGFDINNASGTLALGEKICTTNQAGTIVKTFPAAGSAPLADSYNDIWVLNGDRNGNNITLTPDGTEEFLYNGSFQGAGVSVTLPVGYMAFAVLQATGYWNLWVVPSAELTVSQLGDVTISSIAASELLQWNGSAWINATKEEADIVDRLTPAIETTPYLKHETRTARNSGQETINCEDDPSVYLPVTGNSVSIALTVPTLSLPVRGLSQVSLNGSVSVLMSGGSWTGLTVTSNAGTKISPFPKGTAPNVSGERATLVWKWFDDGTTDLMWAEWILEA